MLKVGSTVKILREHPEGQEWWDKVGELAEINPHASDGDYYGIRFPGSTRVVFFWRDELEVLQLQTQTEQEVRQHAYTAIVAAADWLTRFREAYEPFGDEWELAIKLDEAKLRLEAFDAEKKSEQTQASA